MIRLILFIYVCTFSISGLALEVTLTQGSVKPTPIAVTNFFSSDNNYEKIGKNISNVISDNLERSGLFLSIDSKSFIQDNDSLADQPRFEDWKIIKAQHLVAGKISGINGKISVEFTMFLYQKKYLYLKLPNGLIKIYTKKLNS